MAGVRRGSEGDFGSDRNTRGAKEGGREEGGGGGGRETSSLVRGLLPKFPFACQLKKLARFCLGPV